MNDVEYRELFERYIHGDLDRIEDRDFKRMIEHDAELRSRFDADYDARVAANRWSVIASPCLELQDCFSEATLRRYYEGELDPEAEALIDSHLDCAQCATQLEAFGAPGKVPVPHPMPAMATIGTARGSETPPSANDELVMIRGGVAALPRIPRWVPAGVLAAAAAVLLAFPPAGKVEFGGEVVLGDGPKYRSAQATVGDAYTVRVEGLTRRHYGIRVYLRGEGLQLACPGSEACRRVGHWFRPGVEVEVPLTKRGTYEVVTIVSDDAEPAPPAEDADADIGAARDDDRVFYEEIEVN